MPERVFLGWDRPLLGLLTGWLLARRDELAGTLVVVPTAQGGRRLREALAEAAGSLLAPRVVTPGHFLRTEEAAPESVELLAWVEVLESIRDWEPYAAAFPVSPGEGEAAGWALGLARSLAGLRSSLQENALTLADAARRLSATVEAERWTVLAEFEKLVERRLGQWGWSSRSEVLARLKPEAGEGIRRIVFAGVPDFPSAVLRRLNGSFVPVTVLIGAPASEQEAFDDYGRPLADSWSERLIAWPGFSQGSVGLTADPRQQAAEALRLVAAARTGSGDLALGSADAQTAGELVRSFGRAGWVLHDPSQALASPLSRWLGGWRNYLANPNAAAAIDLLGFPQSGFLAGGRRAQRVEALSYARDKWLARDRDDMVASTSLTLREREQERLALAASTLETLGNIRLAFLGDGFFQGMRRLLEMIDRGGERSGEVLEVLEWLDEAEPLGDQVRRDPAFWIDVLRATLPDQPLPPPEDRVLDVQGWLELFHEPGRHLVICGMNEGMVPSRASTDAWLPEGTRKILNLSYDGSRAARDAYLLTAMIESRREGGRVDLLLAKSGNGGESLLPSRLLLSAPEAELPGRVGQLFREIEPPDSSLAWTLDEAWKWRPVLEEKDARISVTAFSDYLSCPFRFYLKHVAGMSEPEPERVEWNARDFGNVAHIVLERWALDEEARDFAKPEAIEAWMKEALDRAIAERFGKRVPLAVRIQRESMQQRLAWFARVQAAERAGGWQIEEVEKKIEIEIDGVKVVGRVDRIERHEDGRRRVLDYKTGASGGAVESAHRTGIVAATRLPAHLEGVPEILCTDASGKPKRWRNLQVPFYSAALAEVDELGYFSLGATEGEVKLSVWEDFSQADRDSALACARWVIGKVRERVFWPPAEKTDFDDYQSLSLGRTLGETVIWQGGAA